MSKLKSFIKKSIFKIAGEKAYSKAYVKAKVNDIKSKGYEEAELDFVRHFIAKDDYVLDLGANYGHYCVKMAELCPQGKVIAFEPIPFTYKVLQEVVANFNLTNVESIHAAVSDEDGQITMQLPLLDFGGPNTGVAHISEVQSDKSKEVVVTTKRIDSISFSKRIAFIKMDIEGHEPVAVEGMKRLLQKDQPAILIEFSHNCMIRAAHDPAVFSDVLIHELGYQFFTLKEDKLLKVSESKPRDGYYFLIHASKVSNYKELIRS